MTSQTKGSSQYDVTDNELHYINNPIKKEACRCNMTSDHEVSNDVTPLTADSLK